jgi:hypothetical protein
VKGHLILAESASSHPDGTISMLRAWITQTWGEALPIYCNGTLIARIETDIGDAGMHKFDVRCIA